MVNSRLISDLESSVADKCRAFIAACRHAGIDVIITSTFRDPESQAALYAQGRTTPGKIVTNAPAGSSFHNYRVAFDFVPVLNSKPVWANLELFRTCGGIAERCGLEWAGRWKTFKEYAHCQDTGGRTITDFQRGSK